MLKVIGNSGQLSLGKKFAGKYFELQQLEDGSIVLHPMKVVPESEAWVHTPAMAKKLKKAKEWAAKTPAAETDLDAFLKKHKIKA